MNKPDKRFKIKTTHVTKLETTGTMLYTYFEALSRKIKLDNAFPEEKHEIILNKSGYHEDD
jgi:hypothetical protein